MREEPQSHPRPGGVDWWRETELSPSSHQVNCLSSLLSVTNPWLVEIMPMFFCKPELPGCMFSTNRSAMFQDPTRPHQL